MPVQSFSFPVPEIRFFQVGHHVYKFKIRPRSYISDRQEILDGEVVSEELENAVRVVLMNLDNLHPFVTHHFYIFPCKTRWDRVWELRFMRGDVRLYAFPYIITLYVESREVELQDTANCASKHFPPSEELGLNTSSEPKRRRKKHPQEGAHIPDILHHKMDESHLQQFHKTPFLTDGAKGMHGGSELHADSEVPSQPAPGAKNPACEAEQEVSEMSENKKPTMREQESGVFSRLASIAMFPLSLFFKRN